MSARVKVGLYGTNGHQIQDALVKHADAELVAVAAFDAKPCAAPRRYETLEQLLADPAVELISLCSPRRGDQAADAVRCLRAGKHVYAEKPCATTEPDLDAIIAASGETGRQFHEMAGTIVTQPYSEMRRLIKAGTIGTVVQVLAQKSYPWGDWRSADEAIDGGLALQVGVYATRFVEHIAGVKIAALEMVETRLGNDFPRSECRRAVSMVMRLENGGVASAVCNYLNPLAQTCWGYEILRVFGTKGIVESNLESQRLRLMLDGQAPRDIEPSGQTLDYFTLFAQSLRGGGPMPLAIADELSPTRWVIRAKQAA